MKNIVIAGSINMDIVTRLDRYPEKSETVFGSKISFIPGGKGANQARAITRLGGNVRLIAKVGKDQFGKALLNSLTKDRIDIKDIGVSHKKSSGIALIGIDKLAENRIIIIRGSNFELSEKDVTKVNFTGNEIAISQFEIPKETIKAFFTKAKKAGCKTILNPSPLAKITPEILRLLDYLIVNEYEFANLAKVNRIQIESLSFIEGARRIIGNNRIIIVTLGAKGSIAIKGQRTFKTQGFKVNAADTTGAGDSFLGAFTQATAEDMNLEDALIFANAAAALKVTKLGASSMPHRKDVDNFIKSFKRK